MTKHEEKANEVVAAEGGAEAARARRRRARLFAEALAAAIPAEGETVAAAPSEGPRGPRTRVVAEAIVRAIPAGGGAGAGGAGGQAESEP